MTYSLDIELNDVIDETIGSILDEVEEAIGTVRGRTQERVMHREEVDIHELLAGHQAIALVWDADQLLSHHPHLTRAQAWEVLQECERNYTGDEGLCWDDIAEVVTELFPDPADRLPDRAARFSRALSGYADPGEDADPVDLLADARHWCDANERDFAELDRTAYRHYLAQRIGKE